MLGAFGDCPGLRLRLAFSLIGGRCDIPTHEASLLCALFHFALSHLDRHDVNFVLGGILMGFERYLMPFMAIQDLWVGHGPALVVLVDERFPVGADFA